jgi:NAD(P)H-dependent flavin oxidoreductase YrpB (nitropropane dioxygenase family)
LSEFILMLTRDDITVANALELLDDVLRTDVRHVGFKDIGLSMSEMAELVKRLHDARRQVHLEVVSLDEAAEKRSAAVGLELGVDYVIGGIRWRTLAPLFAGSQTHYFPYVGTVTGHPARLTGSAAEIVADALECAPAVDGINLLAYRHRELDGAELAAQVVRDTTVPVIAAGSIRTLSQIAAISRAGVWAFTIGGAVLNLEMIPGASISEQIRAALRAAGTQAGPDPLEEKTDAAA